MEELAMCSWGGRGLKNACLGFLQMFGWGSKKARREEAQDSVSAHRVFGKPWPGSHKP